MRGGRPGQLSIVGASSIHLPNVGAPEGAPLVTRGRCSGLAAGKAHSRRSGAVVGLEEVSESLTACAIRAANRARIFGMLPTRLCPNPMARSSRKKSICPENPMNPGLAHIVKASGIAVLLGLLTSMPAAAALIVVKGGGTSDPASIQSFVDILWTDLSNPNNGSPSSAVGVRSTGTVAVPQSSGVALAFSCKFRCGRCLRRGGCSHSSELLSCA